MKHTFETNEGKIVNFEQEKEEQEHEEREIQQLERSSITKADYYEPEPDNYQSDLIDF